MGAVCFFFLVSVSSRSRFRVASWLLVSCWSLTIASSMTECWVSVVGTGTETKALRILILFGGAGRY